MGIVVKGLFYFFYFFIYFFLVRVIFNLSRKMILDHRQFCPLTRSNVSRYFRLSRGVWGRGKGLLAPVGGGQGSSKHIEPRAAFTNARSAGDVEKPWSI